METLDLSSEVDPNPISISSFEHLVIDIGLGVAVVLGTKAALLLIICISPRAANCRKYEISRNSENAHAKDEAVSEQNTLQVLLDISDKHLLLQAPLTRKLIHSQWQRRFIKVLKRCLRMEQRT